MNKTDPDFTSGPSAYDEGDIHGWYLEASFDAGKYAAPPTDLDSLLHRCNEVSGFVACVVGKDNFDKGRPCSLKLHVLTAEGPCVVVKRSMVTADMDTRKHLLTAMAQTASWLDMWFGCHSGDNRVIPITARRLYSPNFPAVYGRLTSLATHSGIYKPMSSGFANLQVVDPVDVLNWPHRPWKDDRQTVMSTLKWTPYETLLELSAVDAERYFRGLRQ
jgi:hypothetical protein